MSFINHFPLPNQISRISIDNIIKPYGRELSDEEETFHHNRIFSHEVQLLKSQYLLIEQDLISTFDYVYPTMSHQNVFSSKFALIIKNACNLFEIICRKTYNGIYGLEDINIYNYLSLDVFLDFNNNNIECSQLESEFSSTDINILRPFHELQWDRVGPITSNMIPTLWTAYNKIKHDSADYTNYATLSNAIRSVIALAILMYKVYGAGVSVGKSMWYQMVGIEKRYFTIDTITSKLLCNDNGRFFYTFK